MRRPILDIIRAVKRMPIVFNLSSFAITIGKNKKDSAVYIKKLVDKGLIYRITKGLYLKVNDPVVIAGNLPFPSYITGAFALFYWGEGEALSIIDVSTTEYKRTYKSFPIKFHIVKKLGRFTVARYSQYSMKIATKEQAKKDFRRFFRKSMK